MVTNVVSQQQKLTMAMRIAKDYGYYLASVGTVDKPKYLLYKVDKPKFKFVGKRITIDGIVRLTKLTTGFRL